MDFGKASGGGRRSVSRAPAPLTAILYTVGQSRCLELVDLSANGARVTGTHVPRNGDDVLFTAERVRAYGRVIWSDAGQCGIEFDEPICSEAVLAVRQLVSRASGLRGQKREAMEAWTTGLAR